MAVPGIAESESSPPTDQIAAVPGTVSDEAREPSFDSVRRLPQTLTMVWIPELARKRPARALQLRYQVSKDVPPLNPEQIVGEALHAAGVSAVGSAIEGWRLSLPGSTRVYGVISREIDETVDFRLHRVSETWELVLRCEPSETHAAHAAGLAGVMLIAVAVWIAGGLSGGALPATTTVIAGLLLIEFTRQWAFDDLHRRLRRLTGDLGSALWPGVPAQVLDEELAISR